MSKQATVWVDYQSRALEFHVGAVVFPRGAPPSEAGTVVAVWPGIGMVDVEFPHGSKRYPVEDLQINSNPEVDTPDLENNSIPGGRNVLQASLRKAEASLLAKAHVKRALYWGARDRQYRPSRGETAQGRYTCPKHPESVLRKCTYKRREGVSEKLLGCPECMFLIKQNDFM